MAWSFMDFKNIFISCGELSGEIHLSNLVKELKQQNKNLRFYGIGSEWLKKIGCQILADYREISIIGIFEVIKKYFYIKKRLNEIKRFIQQTPISLMILVDFPGLNFLIAQYAKQKGIKIIYFIPPQIWAWHYKRIKKIRELFELVIPILPFEQAIYKKEKIPYRYFGHPIVDNIQVTLSKQQFYDKYKISSRKKLIAFLPGSIKMEIENNLPVMAQVAEKLGEEHDDLVFIINKAKTIEKSLIQQIIKNYRIKKLIILSEQNYNLLNASQAGILVSGTITLEAAYFTLPHIVIYRVHPVSYHLFKMLAKIKYISLPNLIADRLIVPELIQNDLTEKNVLNEIEKIISNHSCRVKMKKQLGMIKKVLGKKGVIRNISREILYYL